MKLVSLSSAPKVPFSVDGYKIHSSSSLEVIHLCLQPGQEIPQHSNPFDVVACLVKGEVIMNTGEEKTRLELYDTIEVEKNTGRGFANLGTQEARLIIIKKF